MKLLSYLLNSFYLFFSVLKLILIIIWIAIICPTQYIFQKLKLRPRFFLPVIFHRGLIYIIGIKILKAGAVHIDRPLLLVGNHSSYLDIIVLGSLEPLRFVAKSEISHWPLFGWMAKLQQTVFIERKTSRTASNVKSIFSNIEKKSVLLMFPEATTSDGNKVLPFKSALFNLLEIDEGKTIFLQSFSVCYNKINGLPINRRVRPLISWFGEMELISHFWGLLKLRSISVTLLFHPIMSVDGLDRKKISRISHKQVSDGVTKAVLEDFNEFSKK